MSKERHEHDGGLCDGCNETPQSVIDYFTSKAYRDVLYAQDLRGESGITPEADGYRQVWICAASMTKRADELLEEARYEARKAEIAADPVLTLLQEAMNFIAAQNHDATCLRDWKPKFEGSENLILAIEAHLWPDAELIGDPHESPPSEKGEVT